MNKGVEYVIKGTVLVFSFFLLALVYNVLLLPNTLVIGGLSGISIIVNKVYGINPALLIFIVNIFLVILSFIFLGRKKTFNTIFGAAFYPLMITLTLPIANFLLPYLTFNDFWIIVYLASILHGISYGLIFKSGFSTGGTDILIQIISKYIKISEGKANLSLNTIIISLAAGTFGITKAFYAIVILIITSFVFDKVLFDQSDSKIFYIYTKKLDEVKKLMREEFNTGFTSLPTVGGYSHESGEMLMCVLPNRDYYAFKTRVLEIDEKAFFVITDSYESQGGYRKKNIPYI